MVSEVFISTIIADQDLYIFKIYVYLCIYIYVYRIQKFWGHMLRWHSNPTKNKVWWPRQTKLLVGFGLGFLRVLMGFDEFLKVFDGVSLGCGEAASSKARFCCLKKPVVLAETT